MKTNPMYEIARFLAPLLGVMVYSVVHAMRDCVGGTVFYLLCIICFVCYGRMRDETMQQLKASVLCMRSLIAFEASVLVLQIFSHASEETRNAAWILLIGTAVPIFIILAKQVHRCMTQPEEKEDSEDL